MQNFLSTIVLVFALAFVTSCFVQQCCAQNDTTFTYQGKLNAGGQPANGIYSFRIALWDAEIGGDQIGNSISIEDHPVSDGLFTLQLDFGGAAFDNYDRWLEIKVEGITLVPRQWITRAPYSIQTRGIFVNDDASFVGIGRNEPVGQAGVFSIYKDTDTFGGMYVETADGGEPFYGYASNNVVDALHYVNGDTGTWHLFNNGNHLNVKRDGFVGIGRDEPIDGDETFGIYRDTDGFAGMTVETNPTGKPFYAYSEGGGIVDARHLFDGDDQTWKLQVGSTEALQVRNDGNVGIGSLLQNVKLNVESDLLHGIYCISTKDNGIGIEALGKVGVIGQATEDGGRGIYGTGLFAESYAGYFFGDVAVTGNLSKSSGSFKIDHPLDPENKYLSHSFVESPDMMNIYNGVVTTGDDGFATVQLPDYFDALNRDFRYQLTVIDNSDEFVIAKITEEIGSKNSFKLRTSHPNVKVSWQVTGVRDDAYARMRPIEVEQDKEEDERGNFLNPDAFGYGNERRIGALPDMTNTPEIE